MSVQNNTVESLVDEIFSLQRALRTVAGEVAKELPVPVASLGVLHLLHSLGECRLNTLACNMGITPSALSRHVADLVDEGYIDRRQDPDDGRASLLTVSEAGYALLKETLRLRAVHLNAMLSRWTETEACHALEAVRHLNTTFYETTGQGRPGGQRHDEPERTQLV